VRERAVGNLLLSITCDLLLAIRCLRWCAHAVGIAAVVSDDALGLLEDVSSECLEDLLHKVSVPVPVPVPVSVPVAVPVCLRALCIGRRRL